MFEIIKEHQSHGGKVIFCSHSSDSTKTKMNFSAFLPDKVENINSAIIWLSGLTCNEENFITKSGVQSCLEGTNTMIICPDTSPRGLALKGEDNSYDFGSGAGFYVNALKEPYSENYKMEDYIVKDIVDIIQNGFGVKKISISGHSMGGHGALILGLKYPELFNSISAFSPIVNPINAPWGIKAFSGYLGDDKSLWRKNDACELLKSGMLSKNLILIDQGLRDEFLEEQLLTKNFEDTSVNVGQKYKINFRDGYDHSYYFISTFIDEHIKHHLKFLS